MEYDQTQSVDENSDASSVEDWMDAWDTGHVTANKLHGIAKYQCTDGNYITQNYIHILPVIVILAPQQS